MSLTIEKCPHCGKDYNFETQYSIRSVLEKSYYETLRCRFCNKFIFVLKNLNYVTLFYFPPKANLKFPFSFNEISPIGIEIYRQSLQANNSGLDHLVGGGLRKALEHIVTDYLIKVQNEPVSILKITLEERIKLLDKNIFVTACAHIGRILGNDFTHYENKHGATIEELIENIEILAVLMCSRYDSIKAEKRLVEIKSNAGHKT